MTETDMRLNARGKIDKTNVVDRPKNVRNIMAAADKTRDPISPTGVSCLERDRRGQVTKVAVPTKERAHRIT